MLNTKPDTTHKSSSQDFYEALKNEIVLQAVRDWRWLVDRELRGHIEPPKSWPKVTYRELRQFFRSEWARTLCGKIDPMYILNRLERERIEILEGGTKKCRRYLKSC